MKFPKSSSLTRLITTAVLLAVPALVTLAPRKASADWGDLFCDIYSNGNLKSAVNLYNNPEKEDRGCLDSIRFFAPMVISLNEPLVIDQYPGSGFSYGGRFRKCIYGSEANCPSMSNTAVVLDFSGYTANGGKCPIRVANGAKFAFANFKVVARDPSHAICRKESDVAVPVDDPENPYAWIHNVKVVGPDDQPPDPDGDGIPVPADNCPETNSKNLTDTDNDGLGDVCDNDDDGDGICDPGQMGRKGGCTGTDNCPLLPNDNQTNTDGDSLGDACDPDDDNDGVLDTAPDNCPLLANTNQANNDGDAQGDACDTDDDNDGVLDTNDNCPLLANTDQANADGDLEGDACDTDDDNDGVPDLAPDNCPTVANPLQEDQDADGLGDICDPDNDNDGIHDTVDVLPLVPSADFTDVPTGGTTFGTITTTGGLTLEVSDLANPAGVRISASGVGGPATVTACSSPVVTLKLDTGDVVNVTCGSATVEAINGTVEFTFGTITATLPMGTSATITEISPGVYAVTAAGGSIDVGGLTVTAGSTVIVTDTDGDGVVNQVDPDDDGDSILDGADNCPLAANPLQEDTDGNGTGDACETPVDSDGDGILDGVDNCDNTASTDLTDTDKDGEGNPCDTDDDNDGVLDAAPDNCPFVLNPLQEDADADGIGDACDALNDSDGDGIIDSIDNCDNTPSTDLADKDNDGLGNPCDTDDDGDGVLDAAPDNCPLTANPLQEDADSDGFGDVCDIGIAQPDADGDGVVDFLDNCDNTPSTDLADTDNDGLGNPCDDDDDGDGVLDNVDNCVLVPNPGQANTNGGPLGDACEFPNDGDGDGILDSIDNCDNTPSTDLTDTDNDGQGNPCDDDDDGDGVLDNVDNCVLVPNPGQADTGGGPLGDACEPPPPPPPPAGCVDTDGDGLCDSLEIVLGTDPNDQDTDNDGTNDPMDCAPLDPARATGLSCAGVDTDFDNDGVVDAADNCPAVPNPGQSDQDGDGIGDVCDPTPSVSTGDSDNDGIPDVSEPDFGTDPSDPDTDDDGLIDGDEVLSPFYPVCTPLDPDCDNDGVLDGDDNCVLVSNGPDTPHIAPEEIQRDGDGDGIGDACEGDFDGDGVPDQVDNCPFNPNPDQEDLNNNDIGDICDLTLSFVKGGGPLGANGGCGCRIDGQSDPKNGLGLLVMGLPLVMFRVMRRRKEIS